MKRVFLNLAAGLAFTTLPIALQADESGSRSTVGLRIRNACADDDGPCSGPRRRVCFRCFPGAIEG